MKKILLMTFILTGCFSALADDIYLKAGGAITIGENEIHCSGESNSHYDVTCICEYKGGYLELIKKVTDLENKSVVTSDVISRFSGNGFGERPCYEAARKDPACR